MLSEQEINKALRIGDLEKIKEYCENGGDIHFDDDLLICSAVLYGHTDMVIYLHQKGVNISKTFYLFTTVCMSGNLRLVEYLHKNGAQVNSDNVSPLVQSILHLKIDVVKYLCDNGASILYVRNKLFPIADFTRVCKNPHPINSRAREIQKYLKSIDMPDTPY